MPSASASDNLRGAALMMATMAAYTINDAFMKGVAPDIGLGPSIIVRGLMATLLIGVLAYFRGAFARPIPRRDRLPVSLRVMAEMGGTMTFLTALLLMPLANVTAVLQVVPLAVTLVAALVFREPLGWRRMGAILVAFGGVMLILRPTGASFDLNALWALAAVCFIVLRDLATRRLTREVPSLQVAFFTSLAITLTGVVLTWRDGWTAPDPGQIGLLAGAAVFILAGYIMSVAAMRVGDVAFVAPFRYTVMIWAIALGWAFFGEVPDAPTILGSAVVIGCGLYAFQRERRLARRPALTMTKP